MNRVIGLFGVLLSLTAQAALSPKEIMVKNEEVRKLTEFEARAKIATGVEGGEEKVKDFTFWRKLQKDQVHNSTFTRFHAPAEVRNEGILIVETPSGRNDVLLYLPNFKKVRRVESQQQSGSFMGSVFSYSDIATPHVEDYEYKLQKEEACGTAETGSIKCYVIESTPSNEDIQERTGYRRSIVWIRQDNFMVARAEYYNVAGELFKKLETAQTKIVDAKSKKWLSHQITVVNQKTKDRTQLTFSQVKVNSNIPDSIFTQQNLQKVE